MLEVLSNQSVRINKYYEETYVESPQESSSKISEIRLLRLNQKVQNQAVMASPTLQ